MTARPERGGAMRRAILGLGPCLVGLCLAGLCWAGLGLAMPLRAEEINPELTARLTPAQRRVYEDYRKARGAFDKQLETYWRAVDAKRDARKARRILGQAYTADDYIDRQPPKYRGPELPAEIARIVTEVRPHEPDKLLANVADFLAKAKSEYGFVPDATSEQDFKHSYAREALSVGLSKDQVLRIYARETGGQGTYDMQSGVNPLTRQGKP